MIVAHIAAWVAAALLIIRLIRYAWRRSPLGATFICAGVLLRAVCGTALYWASLHHLPFMRSLQLGDGFWLLAADAVAYYRAAHVAAIHGLGTIDPAGASPAYVAVLSLALRAFGVTPLAALVLNVSAYAAACTVCLVMWPRDSRQEMLSPGCVIAVAALSFAPSLLLTATQPLKDQVFSCLTVICLLCLNRVRLASVRPTSRGLWRATLFLTVSAVALFGIAGIRSYFALLIVLSATSVNALFSFASPARRWALNLAGTAVVTVVLWMAFVAGAGPDAAPYRKFLYNALHIPIAVSSVRDTAEPFATAREGFVNAGGATNIVRQRAGATESPVQQVEDEGLGLLMLVLPVTLLKALPGVSFSGGRGLLAVTDLDTLFLDFTIAVQLCLVARSWRRHMTDARFLACTIVLALGVMLPMAYVVTNYGTLFRLRLMYAVPLWLSGAALMSPAARPDLRPRSEPAIGS